MNAFATRWLFSTNHKDIGTLYMIFGFFSGMIGTTVSIMLRLNLSAGLFHNLVMLYFAGYFATFFVALCYSAELRERLISCSLGLICVSWFHIQDVFEWLSFMVEFLKNCLYSLGIDLLIGYYQISLLLVVFEGFNTWFWFTTITIGLLPVISLRRHRNNVMLMHNIFCCVEPLLFFLRSAAFLRFGCCMGLGSLFIPQSACGTGEGLPTDGNNSGCNSPRITEGSTDTPRGGVHGGIPDDVLSSVLKNTCPEQLEEMRRLTPSYPILLEETNNELRSAASCNPENPCYAPHRFFKSHSVIASPPEMARMDAELQGILSGSTQALPGVPPRDGGHVPAKDWSYVTPPMPTHARTTGGNPSNLLSISLGSADGERDHPALTSSESPDSVDGESDGTGAGSPVTKRQRTN